MGLYKKLDLKYDSRGFGSSNSYVCSDCIKESYISRLIRNSHSLGKCSFCGRRRNVICVEDMLEIVMPTINSIYVDAEGNAEWDSETKEYLEDVIDHYDFIYVELASILEIENEKLLKELFNIINEKTWFNIQSIADYTESLDIKIWNEFCVLAQESELSAEQIVSLIKKDDSFLSRELITIRDILDEILYCIDTMQLSICNFGESSQYSARRYYRCVNYITVPFFLPQIPSTMVGTAPPNKVKSNRMSEAGDMMLYCSEDEETALNELRAYSCKTTNPFMIGTFVSNKKLTILDLSSLSEYKLPSIFEEDKRDVRQIWYFLSAFMYAISEDVSDDEYKPTQVFTKYIQRNTRFSGIKYKSSKCSGLYYVLFIVNRDCIDISDRRNPNRNQMIMIDCKQYNNDVSIVSKLT